MYLRKLLPEEQPNTRTFPKLLRCYSHGTQTEFSGGWKLVSPDEKINDPNTRQTPVDLRKGKDLVMAGHGGNPDLQEKLFLRSKTRKRPKARRERRRREFSRAVLPVRQPVMRTATRVRTPLVFPARRRGRGQRDQSVAQLDFCGYRGIT